MRPIDLTSALDAALEQAMRADDRVIVIGEDVPALRSGLFTRFGADRVIEAPISESAFLGAGVGAALGGLRPVVEIMFVDFLSVALHQLANEAAMIGPFSNGRWSVPLVIRAACGGGYGDAGQHEQALWGQLAGIPGVVVAVPSNARDAGGLLLSLLAWDGPSVLLEHKLLSPVWMDQLAGRHRTTIDLDIPTEEPELGAVEPVPLGEARVVRSGDDLVIFSLAVGVHRSMQAADRLAVDGIETTVVDLRTVAPLDTDTILRAAEHSGAVLVVDEDYEGFGLSGEIAAVLAEHGVSRPYARVATIGVIPYAHSLEQTVIPSVDRIAEAASRLLAH